MAGPMINCQACSGTGKTGAGVDCLRCGGYGSVSSDPRSPLFPFPEPQTMDGDPPPTDEEERERAGQVFRDAIDREITTGAAGHRLIPDTSELQLGPPFPPGRVVRGIHHARTVACVGCAKEISAGVMRCMIESREPYCQACYDQWLVDVRAVEQGDAVRHPSHYKQVPGIECIEVTQHFNFNRGNALKYIWRAGAKGNEVEDLRKAIQYCEFEIARLEGKPPTS